MSRDRTKRIWRRWAVALSLLAVFGFGCSPSTLAFMFQGDGKKQPVAPLPAKKGKDVVTVAVLANASPTMGLEFAGCERDLARLIGTALVNETKEEKKPIRVIEQSKVERLKGKSGRDWRTSNPAVLGQELGADYVLDVTVNSVTLGQSEFGGEFLQGRANVQVVVYDTEAPDAPMTDYPLTSVGEQKGSFGGNNAGYRSAFLSKVAGEIAHRHIPYVPYRELPNQ